MQIKVNEDIDFVEQIRRAIKNNNGYCPCVIEKNIDSKCMCKDFMEQENEGFCHCGLYYKSNKK